MDLSEKENIINEYHANEMYKLKQICKPLIYKKSVPGMYHDDLYAVASDTLLESLESYDDSRGCSFKTYLTGNIYRAFYDWTRDSNRGVRCNLLINKNGKIAKDENGHPIIISNVSLDAKIENDVDWCERVASDFNIDNEAFIEKPEWRQEIREYLEGLSPLQRKIICMVAESYTPEEICNDLHITMKHYKNSLQRISADEKIKPLKSLVGRKRQCAY